MATGLRPGILLNRKADGATLLVEWVRTETFGGSGINRSRLREWEDFIAGARWRYEFLGEFSKDGTSYVPEDVW